MELLKDYTDAQVRKLADETTPKPMVGEWTLTAPDGRAWTADSPMRGVSVEMNDRVPPLVALARIRCSLMDDELLPPPVHDAFVAIGAERFSDGLTQNADSLAAALWHSVTPNV